MADAVASVEPPLAELGFRRRASGVFTYGLADNVLGWLGLNRATRHRPPGEVEINPVVGVRHQDIERIVAECRGERLHSYIPPTVSIPLGYLMPERRYRTWLYGGGQPVDATVANMVEAIRAYALPFMRSTASLDVLHQRLKERTGPEQVTTYALPVASLLAGRLQRSKDEVRAELAELGGRDDAAAEEFRRFSTALLARIDETLSCER